MSLANFSQRGRTSPSMIGGTGGVGVGFRRIGGTLGTSAPYLFMNLPLSLITENDLQLETNQAHFPGPHCLNRIFPLSLTIV